MNAIPFDTLKMARKLEAVGFSPPQAIGATEALAEAMAGAALATKEDVDANGRLLRTEFKADIAELRSELKADIAQLRAEMGELRVELKSDMAELRTELKSDMAELRTELKSDMNGLRTGWRADNELLRREMTIRLGGMMFAGFGIMLAAMRYMQIHP